MLACDGGASGGRNEASFASRAGRGPVAAESSDPYVRVVGTVQDGGLPHIACSCRRCEAARDDPDRRRWIASLALILPESRKVYLVDATPDIRPQLELLSDVRDAPADRADRSPVDGVFLTHAHIGHYLGLAFFGFEASHTSGLPVFASQRMGGFLRDNGPWSQLVDLNNIRLRRLEPESPVTLEQGVRVVPIRSPHRNEFADTLGFVIEGSHHRLLYLPDTDAWATWPRPIAEVVEEADFALLDGTFYSATELPGRDVSSIGHPLITESMDLLEEVVSRGTTQVYFTHLNHSNPALEPASEARREIESRGFRVVEQGREFRL